MNRKQWTIEVRKTNKMCRETSGSLQSEQPYKTGEGEAQGLIGQHKDKRSSEKEEDFRKLKKSSPYVSIQSLSSCGARASMSLSKSSNLRIRYAFEASSTFLILAGNSKSFTCCFIFFHRFGSKRDENVVYHTKDKASVQRKN